MFKYTEDEELAQERAEREAEAVVAEFGENTVAMGENPERFVSDPDEAERDRDEAEALQFRMLGF